MRSEIPGREVKDDGRLRGIVLGLAGFVGVVFVSEVVAMAVIGTFLPDVSRQAAAFLDATLLSVLVAGPSWFFIARPIMRRLRSDRALLEREFARMQSEVERQQLDARLQRALEMAEDEAMVLAVLERALEPLSPGAPVELLLADSSYAHLRSAVTAGGQPMSAEAVLGPEGCQGDEEREGHYGCSVLSPGQCVAVRSGRSIVFADSTALDACPRLVGRCCKPLTAVCVPVSIGGRAVGVLHSTMSPHTPPPAGLLQNLQILAGQTGVRLGMIRAMAASELAATIDPLTGLLNRRSFEERAAALAASGAPFAVIAADLDHFKHLNDSYSHATGDRALKVFASTLRTCCRPNDIIARLGGEEFVIIAAGATAEQGLVVAERIRQQLPADIARAGTPVFTASFGVVDRHQGGTVEELVRIADAALYAAKRGWRDRVSLAGRRQEERPGRGDSGWARRAADHRRR